MSVQRDHFYAKALTEDYEWKDDRRVVLASDPRANVIGSTVGCAIGDPKECREVTHYPVIDIDHPCRLVESETPGHFHLFIDVPMAWHQYESLLFALVGAGIVEAGYAEAAVATKPWKQERAENVAKAAAERAGAAWVGAAW